jgi:Galactose oxidase, central domain
MYRLPSRSVFKYFALFVAAALLTSCGGGDEGSGGEGDINPGPTRFVEHPRDVTVAVGASATFTASFAGEAPLSVNWTRGGVHIPGVPIPGTTSSTYVTPPVTATDDGLTFGLVLTVPPIGVRGGASLHSRMATLTVVPPPPTVPGVFTTAGAMMQARVSHTATLLPNGKVLLVGGAPPDATPVTPAFLASAELYDPVSNTFTATGSMSTDRVGHTATLLADGKVLIAGGRPFTEVPTAEIYDPATGRFTATGSLNVARDGRAAATPVARHAAVRLLDGRVLIAGGSFTAGSSAELFDPATGTFSATGSMTQARDFAQAEVLTDGRALILDGSGNQGDLYNVATGTFTATSPAPLNAPWRGIATARLADGRVLVVGGRHGVGTGVLGSLVAAPLVSAAQLFDPVSNAFMPSGRLIWPREEATATRLVDGRVLMFGGVADDRWPNRGEVYDPVAATFTATVPLDLGRHGHTATLLPNGKVLIAGGWAASSNAVARVAAPSVLFEQY